MASKRYTISELRETNQRYEDGHKWYCCGHRNDVQEAKEFAIDYMKRWGCKGMRIKDNVTKEIVWQM